MGKKQRNKRRQSSLPSSGRALYIDKFGHVVGAADIPKPCSAPHFVDLPVKQSDAVSASMDAMGGNHNADLPGSAPHAANNLAGETCAICHTQIEAGRLAAHMALAHPPKVEAAKPALFLARQALARGENERARQLLAAVLMQEPDSLEANRLLRQLNAAKKTLTAPAVMPDAAARWPRCPHCQAQMPPGKLPGHIARAHPPAKPATTPTPAQAAAKIQQSAPALPLPAPAKAKTKPRKRRKRAPILEDRAWGSDALDHAVSLNSTEGIAWVKASRKRRGQR